MNATTITREPVCHAVRCNIVRMLADAIRADNMLTGEDVADIVAFVDQEALCPGHRYRAAAGPDVRRTALNYCNGVCVEWHGPAPVLVFALIGMCTALEESAADLMQSVLIALDW